jgi:hypothetical protein
MMEATEQDDALSLRGFVISRTGCLPTERAFRELSANEPLLRFTVHWLQKRDNDLLDAVTKLLGTTWTRTEVEQMVRGGDSAAAPDRVFLPVTLGCNPQLTEQLKELFRIGKGSFIGGGEYQPSGGEQVVELGELPVDEFKRLAAMATGMATQAEQTREQAGSVTLGNEGRDDPKLQRMREQIAHSKRFR